MHMWMWFGYNLGEFMFPGLNVVKKTEFAITCVVLFIISFLFEGSKVYVARTQRKAARCLYPHRRNDERRNLLWDTTTEIRDAGPSHSSRRVRNVEPVSTKRKVLINLYQASLFLLHNVLGYLLMLAVMVYNVYVMVVIVLGMIAGYFVFGPMLTRMQMECFAKEGADCTEKCDDNAEGTSPFLHTSLSSDSDFFVCQTTSCSRLGDSTATGSQMSSQRSCCYGAKHCPSKVAVIERLQKKEAASHCHHIEQRKDGEMENIKDAMLLHEDSRACCHSTPHPVALDPVVRVVTAYTSRCTSEDRAAPAHEQTCEHTTAPADKQTPELPTSSSHHKHERSPQITCCHSNMNGSDSQQNML